MREFGLIGFPLGHSFSEKYFNDKFRSEGPDDCHYALYPLENISLLPSLVNDRNELCGLNVTIPYKTAVIKFLDETDSEAKDIGAVNVIKITRSSDTLVLRGYNTDAPAFRQTVLNIPDTEIKSALVLGTGGASAGVCHAFKQLNVRVIKVSREEGKGDLTYKNLGTADIQEADIIVNTTPVGMYPAGDRCPLIDYDSLLPQQILYDLIYNPGKTEFLSRGEKHGCRIINGLEMLHLQAEMSWKIWNEEGIR